MAERKLKQVSLLRAAIPPERGPAVHIERNDDFACTEFDNKGKVKQFSTPQDALRRIHEVLHANHTKPGSYFGIRDEVAQVIEDCRLHLLHWPWPMAHSTPEIIKEAAKKLLSDELNSMAKVDPKTNAFGIFATKFRAQAVYYGMGEKVLRASRMEHMGHKTLAETLLNHISGGRFLEAAKMLEAVFFPEEPPEELRKGSDEERIIDSPFVEVVEPPPYVTADSPPGSSATRVMLSPKGKERLRELGRDGVSGGHMDIVELPRSIPILAETAGFRVATSGSRLYRPALRRPVLPQRIFWRRSPVMPGGAVVFDASGSMGVTQEVLLDCCLRAPTAAVAYYAGSDSSGVGTLWVFAKDGLRAPHITAYPNGNGVDGFALDWLMEQEAPRSFVTDLGFTCPDAQFQVARLATLEMEEEVTVYHTYAGFQEAHPRQEHSVYDE